MVMIILLLLPMCDLADLVALNLLDWLKEM